PLSDSDSSVPLLLDNADELYDSSTSCWNPAIRNESNACIELFASCRSLCKGERFLIASRFPTPPLACAFFSPGATVTDCSCSKGNVEDKILVPKPPKNYARCAKCGHPVNGPYCQGCALLREKLEEDLVTYLKYFQDTFESSDDSTNVVNAPREPFVVKQDHGVKSSQNPPNTINFVASVVLLLAWDQVFEIKDALGTKQYKLEDIQELFRQLLNDVQNIHEELAKYINTPGWNRPAFYEDDDDDDDVDYIIAITPVLSTEETENSLTKNHFEIAINSNDDISSSDDESLYIENIDGSTTTHSDTSLSDYEVFSFKDDHIEKISSGSTTTHFDISLSEYDSFIFDLTHEEFANELAHIISPPKYDCFYFWNLPDPATENDYSPLLAYVVWIFVAYLTYPVIPPYLHPFGNEDTIKLMITLASHQEKSPDLLPHRCGIVKKFNTHRSHLNTFPMLIHGQNNPPLDVLLFHFYPP
nr:hypothetical protein [Tanacetum cinerariifolium]